MPLPFYCEYRDLLPSTLTLHVASNGPYYVEYDKKSYKIQGLGEMMRLYGLKPYQVVIMHYIGEGVFYLKFYSPYAVQILVRKTNELASNDTVCSKVEAEKLHSTIIYNGYCNFLGMYNLLIESKHMIPSSNLKVFFRSTC